MRAFGIVLVLAIFGGGGFWFYRRFSSEKEPVAPMVQKSDSSALNEKTDKKHTKSDPKKEISTNPSGDNFASELKQKKAKQSQEIKQENKIDPAPSDVKSPHPLSEPKNLSYTEGKETVSEKTPFDILEELLSEKDDAKLWSSLRKNIGTDENWLDACRQIGTKLLKDRPFIAWVLLSHAYRHTQDEKLRKELHNPLSQLSKTLFYSFRATPASIYHIVEPGDTLSRIQNDYVVPYRLLMRINGLSSTTIHIGQRIKVPVTPEKKRMEAFVQVDKSEHTLTVFVNGLFVRSFKVALGKEDRTPKGKYVISSKVYHPSWRGLPYGHPENIIGDWWLGLSGNGVFGIGIHGTNDPSSIGENVSQGCVRMLNEDVSELANTVPKGTEVEIRD